MTFLKKTTFLFLVLNIGLVSGLLAQEKKEKTKKVNFGYSSNPPSKVVKKKTSKEKKKADKTDKETVAVKAKKKDEKTPEKEVVAEVKKKDDQPLIKDTENAAKKESDIAVNNVSEDPKEFESVSVAKKTREVAKEATRKNLSPTEIYKVGIDDVLFINLQNSSARYYTVLKDGTIDYPLAGKLVSVVDLTIEEIEDLLREKITLYENPQVTVKVREYASHKINVKGAARDGEYFLQREAMPLVVIKSMVGVEAKANRLVVTRAESEPNILDLTDDESNSFLIKPGDSLMFENDIKESSGGGATAKFYFVGEKICDGGRKKFYTGLTLVQALFEVCGGLNKKLKMVKVIRKTESGRFVSKEYDFREILQGKQTDPALRAGDLIDSNK